VRITYEEVIPRPPDVVFPWIAEPEKAMRWQKNVRGGEFLHRTPEMIGSTFTEIIEEDGGRLEMTGIVTKYIENRLIGFHIASRLHDFDVEYRLEPVGGDSKFRIEAEIRWKFPMNILGLFIGRQMKENLLKELRSETQELKEMCELG